MSENNDKNNHTHCHNPIEKQQEMADSLQMMLTELNQVSDLEERLEIARLAYLAKAPMAVVYYTGELLNCIKGAKDNNDAEAVVEYGREFLKVALPNAAESTAKMIAEEITSQEIANKYIEIAEKEKLLGNTRDFSVMIAENIK